jgi:WD40 repeat protein
MPRNQLKTENRQPRTENQRALAFSVLGCQFSVAHFFLCVSAAFCFPSSTVAAEPTYWSDIRPLFRKHCIVCHSAKNVKELDVSGGLALDSYEAILKGAKQPPLIVGKSKESKLVHVLLSKDEEKRMPKDSPALPVEQIDLITRWIDGGAKEGMKPAELATAAASSSPRSPGKLRKLDVVLATSAIPPKGLFSLANPGPLQLVIPAGPLAPATAVCFSPDGNLLATGAYGRVTIWDLNQAKPAKVLTSVLGAVNDLRFSPDGKLLAVAGGQPSFKGDLRLYRTSDWQLVATLAGHDDVVFSIVFSPESQRLASASFDKTVRVWDVASHKSLLRLDGHSDFVYGVAFSPDGKWLASCSKDRSVKITDASTGQSRQTISGMNEDILAVAFHPDGKSIVSSGYETSIFWWAARVEGAAVDSGQVTASPRIRAQGGHGIAVHELVFSKDGKLLASASADGTARLWNGENGSPIRTLAVGSVVYAVALNPDGKRLATGGFDGQVKLWDAASGRHLVTLLTLPSRGDDWLALTPEGYYSASDSFKPMVGWRMNGQPIPNVEKHLNQHAIIVRAIKGETTPAPKFD